MPDSETNWLQPCQCGGIEVELLIQVYYRGNHEQRQYH